MSALPPIDPVIEISVASHGMSRAVAQTEGPQVLPKAFLQLGAVQLGGQWKNVKSPVADGEAAIFINASPKLGDFQLSFGAAYKFQTNVSAVTDDKSLEFSSSVSRKLGKVGLKASAFTAPTIWAAQSSRSIWKPGHHSTSTPLLACQPISATAGASSGPTIGRSMQASARRS